MDRFELVEKLVKSTGVSFEDAKIALESSGWDLLDAAVWLERNGKVESRSGHFTTDPEQQQQQARSEEQQQRQQRTDAPRGSARSAGETGTTGKILHGIFSKIKGILTDNELVICKQSGEIFLELPIWLSVLLLIVAFWPAVGLLILVFILGFRFRLHGPDLGGDMINGILNKAENSASDFVSRVKNSYSSSRNSSGNSRNDDVIDYEEPHRKE